MSKIEKVKILGSTVLGKENSNLLFSFFTPDQQFDLLIKSNESANEQIMNATNNNQPLLISEILKSSLVLSKTELSFVDELLQTQVSYEDDLQNLKIHLDLFNEKVFSTFGINSNSTFPDCRFLYCI